MFQVNLVFSIQLAGSAVYVISSKKYKNHLEDLPNIFIPFIASLSCQFQYTYYEKMADFIKLSG